MIPFRMFQKSQNSPLRSRFAHLVLPLAALLAALLFAACGPENEVADEPVSEPLVLSPAEMDARYAEANALFEAKGEESRDDVRAIMTSLAPLAPGEMGHPGAHLWIAQDLLRTVNRLPGKLRKQTMAGAASHLEKSIALDSSDEAPYLALAQLYTQQKKPEQAIELLTGAMDQLPGLKVLLAYTYQAQENQEMAEKFASEGADYWENVAAEDPENSIAYLRWARAEMLLGNDDEVLSILEEGRKHTDPKPFDQYEFSIRMRQVREALSADPPRPGEAIDRIDDMIARNPGNQQAILKLSDIGVRFPEARQRVRDILEALSQLDDPPWPAFYALATIAMEEGDFAKALPHAEKNFELAPKSPFVIINYAWCLCKVSPPNLNRALEVIETIPPGFKTNPIAQRTRGRILVRLGRHEEGIEELRKSLPSIPAEEQMEAHELMAEAHEALGNFDLAVQHRERSKPGTDPKLLATVPLPEEKQKKKKKKKKGGEDYEPGVRKVMLPTKKSAAPSDAVKVPDE